MTNELNTPKVNIPEGIAAVAQEVGIPNASTAYYEDEWGRTVTQNGEPIVDRFDPERLQQEANVIDAYLENHPEAYKRFLDDVVVKGGAGKYPEVGINEVVDGSFGYINEAGEYIDMDEECRVSVIIPSRYEAGRIGKVIEGYAKQEGIDFNQFELMVTLNIKDGEEPDSTIQVIEDYKRKYPHLRVNYIDLRFLDDGPARTYANVGMARKVAADLVLKRHRKRDGYYGPHYMITADADETKVDSEIVLKTILGFDTDKEADFLMGRQDRSAALISQNHLMQFSYTGAAVIESLGEDSELRDPYRPGYQFYFNRILTKGWAGAFTAEAYAVIGGYPLSVVGEDVYIGNMISIARGGKDIYGNFVPNTSTIKTFDVRGESNFLRFGHSLIERVETYDPSVFVNEDIKQVDELIILRALESFQLLDETQANVLERFNSEVVDMANWLRNWVSNDQLFLDKYLPAFLDRVGFVYGDVNYHLVSEGGALNIHVHNWSNLRERLEEEREKHRNDFEQQYLGNLGS